MQLIGITGRAGTGKDTVANFLAETQGFARIAFADPIRDGAMAMLGLSPADLADRERKEAKIKGLGCSPRHIMQTLGTAWGREMIHPDLWIYLTAPRVRHLMQSPAHHHIEGIVISDVRFENEADWIRQNGGHIWHIRRDGAGLSGACAAHISEQDIPRHTADHVLHNNSTLDELHLSIDWLISALRQTEAAA